MSAIKLNSLQGRFLEFFLVAFLWMAVHHSATAAPSDMQVMTDDIVALHQAGLEFQTNIAKLAMSDPLGPRPVWQGLFEPSYGIADHWEVSLQLPVTQLKGTWYATGLNAEAQYVAPHDESEGFYWGSRVEFSGVNPVGLQKSLQSEWRAILGYRFAEWHIVLNPAFTAPITGADRQVTFEPSAKALHNIGQNSDVGVEIFEQAGAISRLLPSQQRYELAMVVMDTKIEESDLNVGVGKGLNNATDRWVVKAIYSVPLNNN